MKLDRRRALIALAVAAAAAAVYILFIRGKTSSSLSPAAAPAPTATGSDGSGGGDSGGGGGVSPDEQALLSSLAGENQDLLDQLLKTSLPAGISFGAPAPTDTSSSSTPSPTPDQPAPAAPAPAAVSVPAAIADSSPYAGFTADTITSGAAAGGVIYTPTPAMAAAIDQSPNVLRTVGSDAAQIQTATGAATPTPSVEQKTLATAYGGGKTSGQVKRNL